MFDDKENKVKKITTTEQEKSENKTPWRVIAGGVVTILSVLLLFSILGAGLALAIAWPQNSAGITRLFCTKLPGYTIYKPANSFNTNPKELVNVQQQLSRKKKFSTYWQKRIIKCLYITNIRHHCQHRTNVRHSHPGRVESGLNRPILHQVGLIK